jgi:hypothetical protein
MKTTTIKTEETPAELSMRLVRELQAAKCFCGAKKVSGQTFCKRHYYDLPRDKRLALYNRIGQGYEEAYQEARGFFETNRK